MRFNRRWQQMVVGSLWRAAVPLALGSLLGLVTSQSAQAQCPNAGGNPGGGGTPGGLPGGGGSPVVNLGGSGGGGAGQGSVGGGFSGGGGGGLSPFGALQLFGMAQQAQQMTGGRPMQRGRMVARPKRTNKQTPRKPVKGARPSKRQQQIDRLKQRAEARRQERLERDQKRRGKTAST